MTHWKSQDLHVSYCIFKSLLFHVADTDEDMNFRRPKRHRTSFRPPSGPRTPRSDDDGDGATPSSPGRSQRGYSGGDVPMTDQTDDDPFEVLAYQLN